MPTSRKRFALVAAVAVLVVIAAACSEAPPTFEEEFGGVTGIVLTKLDGTAKGGIAVAIEQDYGVPVKFIGVGEGVEDLIPFEPAEFIDALLADV